MVSIFVIVAVQWRTLECHGGGVEVEEVETGGQGYSLEVLAHFHGIIETFLIDVKSALKFYSRKPASSPQSLLSGG